MIIGIDPGLHGAIAFLNESDLRVVPMPIFELTINGGKRHRIDTAQLAAVLDLHRDASAIVEDVHAMPRQGVASSFSFGLCCGAIHGILAAYQIPMRLVSPARWKRDLGLTADKDAARALASRVYPKYAHLWPLKGDDGKAEAALLCAWGAR